MLKLNVPAVLLDLAWRGLDGRNAMATRLGNNEEQPENGGRKANKTCAPKTWVTGRWPI